MKPQDVLSGLFASLGDCIDYNGEMCQFENVRLREDFPIEELRGKAFAAFILSWQEGLMELFSDDKPDNPSHTIPIKLTVDMDAYNQRNSSLENS